MKVVTLLGSPRAAGNTARLLDLFEAQVVEQGNEVERIHVGGLRVLPCTSCYTCFGREEYGCVLDDAAELVFARMSAADALVWAAPIYCWGFPAQMKALIDRTVSQVKGTGTPQHRSAFEDKPAALLMTGYGARENNADLVSTQFTRMLGYHKCLVGGELIVTECTDDTRFDDEVRETLRIIAGSLGALVR